MLQLWPSWSNPTDPLEETDFPSFLGQDSRNKALGGRTNKGGLKWGERFTDSDDSTEKHHQEECRRAAAERTKRLKQGLAMTGKVHWLIDAEARAELLGEVEPPDLDQFP